MFLPIAAVVFHIDWILLMLSQDPEPAKFARDYAVAYLPGIYLSGLFDSQRKFLNLLQKNKVPMYCSVIG